MKKLLITLAVIGSVNAFAIKTNMTIVNNTDKALPIHVIDSDHFDCKTTQDSEWINCGKNNNLGNASVPAHGQFNFVITQDSKQSSSLKVRLGYTGALDTYDFGMWTYAGTEPKETDRNHYSDSLRYNQSWANYDDGISPSGNSGDLYSMLIGTSRMEATTSINTIYPNSGTIELTATVTVGQAPIAQAGVMPW